MEFSRALGFAVILLVGGGCSAQYHDVPYTGAQRRPQIVDADANSPVSGAYVAFTWRETRRDPSNSQTFCVHEQLERSDEQGRFEIPLWRGMSPSIVAVYKSGMSRASTPESKREGIEMMRLFAGTTAERYEEFNRILNATNCGDAELRAIVPLYEAIVDEGMRIRRSKEDYVAADGLESALNRAKYGWDKALKRSEERDRNGSQKGGLQ